MPDMVCSGFITLLGLPNAGKSSLLNAWVGERLAIVTPKPQTTWKLMRGYVVRDGLELVVTDTPGVQEGTKALNAALSKNAAKALQSAREGDELVAVVLDAADLGRRLRDQKPLGLDPIEHVLAQDCGPLPLNLPAIVILNKADLVRKPEHRAQIEEVVQKFCANLFREVGKIFWTSVAQGKGLEAVLEHARTLLPQAEKGSLFEADALSDRTLRDFASEFIREQCFMQLGEEIPYSVAVEIEKFDESDPSLVRIDAVLHVERDSQKPMVIGKAGSKIKSIGTAARQKIEALVGHKAFLGLRVKVTPHWAREETWVQRFGYVERG